MYCCTKYHVINIDCVVTVTSCIVQLPISREDKRAKNNAVNYHMCGIFGGGFNLANHVYIAKLNVYAIR